MQDQAEQLSKSRKKFLATTYQDFFSALYSVNPSLSIPDKNMAPLDDARASSWIEGNQNLDHLGECRSWLLGIKHVFDRLNGAVVLYHYFCLIDGITCGSNIMRTY